MTSLKLSRKLAEELLGRCWRIVYNKYGIPFVICSLCYTSEDNFGVIDVDKTDEIAVKNDIEALRRYTDKVTHRPNCPILIAEELLKELPKKPSFSGSEPLRLVDLGECISISHNAA